jgi:hypothetical protein
MENKWNLFEKFLITENSSISLVDFLISSVTIIILCWLLGITYQKVAKSLSNRKDFSANFMILAFTTMLIITIVKSSLALSLGLVGALSIVRFRAAIKEPEELAFIFFSISIGLGLGANQIPIVLTAFGIFMVILWGRFFIQGKSENQNIFVSINSNQDKVELNVVRELMTKHFNQPLLKRFDQVDGASEIAYVANVQKSNNLELFRNELLAAYPNTNISFLDSKAY